MKKPNCEFTLPAYQWWIIIALVAAFYVCLFTGCEICEECTTTTYQVGGIQDPYTSTREVCGRDEIKNAKKEVTTDYGSGVIVKSTTKCK